MNRFANLSSIAAPVATLAAAALIALPQPAQAAQVFTSGPVADITDDTNFLISDTMPTIPVPFSGVDEQYRMTLGATDPASPITARSITFFGFSVATPGGLGQPDGELDHGFDLVLGSNLINILAIERTDIGPNPFPALVAAGSGTNVQQVTIDFDPVTVAGGDDVLFRGTGGLFSNFYAALADPANPNITFTEYSDLNFTVVTSTTVGQAFAFTLDDSFQVIPEPATAALLALGLPLLARRRRQA
ncbi:MAG: PEP-CTERM sorting domain-containing protein [Planctomycetota bacterium]